MESLYYCSKLVYGLATKLVVTCIRSTRDVCIPMLNSYAEVFTFGETVSCCLRTDRLFLTSSSFLNSSFNRWYASFLETKVSGGGASSILPKECAFYPNFIK